MRSARTDLALPIHFDLELWATVAADVIMSQWSSIKCPGTASDGR